MNKSILIIDDEQTIRESLHLFLSEEGFLCQVAKDGQEAVEKICSTKFDVILLDLHMPRQKGLNVLAHVKKNSPKSIVIILSEYFHIDEAALALRQGASKLVLKPIDFEELLDVVKQQIDIKNTH